MNNFNEISSKDNRLIKYVSKLQTSSKFRYSEKKIVVEGLRISKDVLENGVGFDTLIVGKSFFERYKNEVAYFSEKCDNNYIIPDSLFEKISDTETPQGIILVTEMPNFEAQADSKKKYIALDNLQDPSNLGAIARTCEALGVGGIILNNISCDPFSPKSLRASMGTLLRMPVFITDNLIEFFNKNGLKSYSCVIDKDAKSISSVNFNIGDVIIIGNEANGISDFVKSNSTAKITIPMSGTAESLNAASAAAIAIYELTK
ncbi:MAG: RNA methyltransferase [Clostridia bacterium]|nr:RNA methyltransferase [Clostridia bacterium]